ncbi:MAG: lauroyl acyltransferase [Spirochaetaceae bacterium]|nr:lauroyl acyltransferase [Spirochaetaceae bacterium]|tara:strand:- start:78140 stop:79054 length:915 start_codon:yes stop_codon:yes gene_type:complete
MFGDFLIYLLILGFSVPFRILPYRWCLGYGKFLAGLLYPISGKQRRIAADNIRQSFPDKDEAWVKDTTRKNWFHLGHLIADSFYGPRMNQKFYDKYLVYEGDSRDQEAKALERGNGIICNCGHLGTWELLVQYTGRILKGGGIYKKLSNPFVDRWYKKVRESSGIELFEVEESQKAIRYLRKGGRVGFVSDQNAGQSGIFVDFFGRPASTFRGPALMAGLTGSNIVMYSAIHKKGGKVHVKIEDLGTVDFKGFQDRESAIRHYTEKWVKALESQIRSCPEQYFWVHRRWKTKPPEATATTALSS